MIPIMRYLEKSGFCVLLAALSVYDYAASQPDTAAKPQAAFAEYAGVYLAGPLAVLEVGAVDDYISLVPPFWGGKPYFVKDGGETFSMALPSPRPDRTATFQRRADGAVVGLVLTNVEDAYDGKRFERVTADAPTPAQLFLGRKPVEAAKAALADKTLTADRLYEFAYQGFLKYPSRRADTVTFLRIVAAAHPEYAPLASLLGYSLIAAGRRDEARTVLANALRLDPENPLAWEASRRLGLREPEPGKGYRAVLPFSLDAAFAPPTQSEIEAVRRAWALRDLSARNVLVVHRFELPLSHGTFEGEIIRHTISGVEHYGAVLVPKGATGPLPVVIDARGVNFFYSPLDISGGVESTTALAEAQTDFVYVIPSMRGHKIIVNGAEFKSGGDSSDAWDGATDDTLVFLNVVLATIPQADERHIAIVGRSRGGTVAMLAGERDGRISLVQSISGPTDRFEAMDPVNGWRWTEILADDMSDGKPSSMEEQEEGSQVFDHFFDRVLTDGEDLRDVRMRMFASSPLFFIETLPQTDAYYGAEDSSVPLANAMRLRERADSLSRSGSDLAVHVFEGRGHDTDPYLVNQSIKERLIGWAKAPR